MFPFREIIYIFWILLSFQGNTLAFFFPTPQSGVMFFIFEFVLIIIQIYTTFIVLGSIAVFHRCVNIEEYPRSSSYTLAYTTFFFNPVKGFKEIKTSTKFEPEVSIIICSKDEEENISKVLTSLIAVDYPKDKYEIIVVDESKDKTPEIVRKFIQGCEAPKIRMLNRFELPLKPEKFNPVAYGISLAVKEAKNEYIIVTEADCVVPKQYIRRMVHPYLELRIACAGSHAVFTGNSLIEQLLRLDLCGYVYFGAVAVDAVRHSDLWGIKNWKLGGGCWGGSLSFLKSIFNEIEGYKDIEEIGIQDIALTNKILLKSDKKMRMVLDQDAKVESPAETSWKRGIMQRLRWFIGSNQVAYNLNIQFLIAQFFWFFFPFIAETGCIIIMILSFTPLLPTPAVYGPILSTIFPPSMFFLQNLNFWLALFGLIFFLVFRYVTLYQITHYERLLKNYKVGILTWILFPFWMYLIEWLMLIAVFKKKYKWK